MAATRRALAQQHGFVLAGPSWGCLVASGVGNNPKVAGLVYVAAAVPDASSA